jgi:flagellar biosynthesis protein FliQ
MKSFPLVLAVSDSQVIQIAVQMLMVTAKVSAPILVVSLAVGFGMSLVQSVTQLQDATLAFVPKLIAVAAVIVVAGHWMLAEMVTFTQQMFDLIPSLLREN